MEPIVVREYRKQLVGLLVLVFMPGSLVYGKISHHQGFDRADWLSFALLLLPGLWFIITGWSTVTGDDDGLRLRTFRGTRRVPWDSIRDFYVLEFGETADAVEFDDRRLLAWVHEHPRAESLRQLVLAHATSAATREWATREARTVESLPCTFEYPPPRISWTEALVASVPIALVVGALAIEFSRGGWALLRAPYLVSTAFKLTALPLLVVGLEWPWLRARRDLRRRQGQRVNARAEGLRYDDGSREVAMTWEEITRVVPSGSAGSFVEFRTIESSRGSFEVSNAINDYHRLMELIARRAPRAMEAWRDAENRREDLLPPTTQPGVKVHHYRTRPERNVLWTLGAVFVVIVGLALYRRHFTDAVITSLIFGTPLTLFAVRYLATRVTTDARGITYERLGRKGHLAWSELDRWRPAGADAFAHLLIEGRDQRWRIWSGLSDVVGLVQTLEAHRPTTAGKNP